jgi:hypothetical protein
MERTKFSPAKELLAPSNEEEWYIYISMPLMETFLKEKHPEEVVGLYTFYYYMARQQKTNRPKATGNYVMEALKISSLRFYRAKKRLVQLGLIEDIKVYNGKHKATGYYVKVNFVWSDQRPTLLKSQPVGFCQTNALSVNTITCGEEEAVTASNPIVPSLFEKFWKTYPRKIDKGKALTAWNKLCKKPPKERPTWREVKIAILKQQKTERWKDGYIPHPTTWLNQSRWLDDPAEMKSTFKPTNGNKEPMYEDGIKYVWDEKIQRYRHSVSGDIYIP